MKNFAYFEIREKETTCSKCRFYEKQIKNLHNIIDQLQKQRNDLIKMKGGEYVR